MLRKTFLILAVCATILGTPTFAEEMTLEEIIAGHVETRGGIEALKAVESAQLTGKMTMGPGMEAPFTVTYMRPNKVRMEFVVQGMTAITAYDGETGWGVMPFMGKTEPEPLADDQLKDVVDQADFDGPLIDWKEKGHTVELVGTVDIEGTPAYELKVTKENGDITHSFLDTEHFLEFQQKGKRKIQGNEMVFVTSIGDYKEVGDIIIAHAFEASPEGTEFKQVITLDKVELNVDVDETLFDMPAAEKKEEMAEAAGGR